MPAGAHNFKTNFSTDGSGNWEIELPAEIDEYDFMALKPVVKGIQEFLRPTLTVNGQPIPYQLAEAAADGLPDSEARVAHLRQVEPYSGDDDLTA